MNIVRVALPLPIDRLYSYEVPIEMRTWMRPGRRVVVPFGKRKLAGVVIEAGIEDDFKGYTPKQILNVDVELPPLPDEVLDLTRWVSTYYMCAWGEALRAALPPGSSAAKARTRVQTVAMIDYNEEGPEALPRGDRQRAIVEQLRVWHLGEQTPVPQARILAEVGGSAATIRRLEELGYLFIEQEERDRFQEERPGAQQGSRPELHAAQATSVSAINEALTKETYHTFLLHGVTGSGKTEVYLRVLETVRQQGRTAIVLVPEISLTPQTVRRFRSRFGDEVAVLHSRMGDGERYDAWRGIGEGRYPIVIGPRSAVLAPVKNPALIIVDEEHESSYKQFDPAPRYHARDVAVIRAMKNGAVCILGSATPSLESLSNARADKYTLLEMPERVPVAGSPARLPQIRIVDLRNESDLKGSSRVLSKPLVDGIDERAKRGEQTILLLNRRGYAPVMECTACGWVPECPDCSVSMVYHRPLNHLRCHYCGVTERPPTKCASCDGTDLAFQGTGTQRLESELAERLPDVRVLRMDLDTTSQKGSHHAILDQFGRGDADVLLGTQMVAKGLDFEKVTLVGIIRAEAGLQLPDIRAEERGFQLLTQVAGRAGRADLEGEVMLQCVNPGHPVIQFALRHDYIGFTKYALEARTLLNYPPAGRLVSILFSGTSDEQTRGLADKFRRLIDNHLTDVDRLGPSPAFIHRLKNRYRHQLLLKVPGHVPASRVRDGIERAQKALGSLPAAVRMTVDVDPVGLV
ncbi:MAG: primosomal protein N' [Bacteroidota bacterium]|nr:primosomal protein N' [Bacteroidota bacterium]